MLTSKTLWFATVFSILFSITSAHAQAFGIEKGTSIKDLTIVSDVGGGLYQIIVPSPHSEFEAYAAKATPETGVCQIRGIGKDHENNRFGTSVQDAFSSLRSALESRYGKHGFADILKTGALWDAYDEWVMSLHQNERVFQAVWDARYESDLPDGLEEIILTVHALSSDNAYVLLQYRFDNDEECSSVLSKKDEGGL